jgi:hypothetical protein
LATLTDGSHLQEYANGTSKVLKHKILSIFGQYFVAFDWHTDVSRLLIFDTFKEQTQEKFELIAASPSNENLITYSIESHNLVHTYRDKLRDKEQVFEDYKDIDVM